MLTTCPLRPRRANPLPALDSAAHRRGTSSVPGAEDIEWVARRTFERAKRLLRRRGPLDFIGRLCALVPPPRFNMVRYYGVFAVAYATKPAELHALLEQHAEPLEPPPFGARWALVGAAL